VRTSIVIVWAASLVAGCFAVPPTGKADEAKTVLDKLSERGLRLRSAPDPVVRAFEDPARIQVKDPAGDGNSTVVTDLAVLWEHDLTPEGEDSGWTIGPFAEYHRNTVGTQNVETFGAGVGLAYYDDAGYNQLFDPDAIAKLSPEQIESLSAVIYRLALSAQRDRVKDNDGVRAKTTASYVRVGWVRGPSTKGSLGHLLTFQPTAGLLWDHGDNVASESGDRAQWLVSGASRLYLAPQAFVDRLYLEGIFTYWEDLWSSGGYDDVHGTCDLTRISLNMALDNLQRAVLALEYSNGENPEAGQVFEEAIALTVRLKL